MQKQLVFLKAKQELGNDYSEPCNGGYLFDILGDPAIPLPFPKLDQTTFSFDDSSPNNELKLLEPFSLIPKNIDEYSFIEIYSSNNEVTLSFQDEESIVDLTFNYSPDIYFQNEFKDSTCYIPPLDLISFENIFMKYYSERNNIKLNRIQKRVVSSMKQSLRAYIPKINDMLSIDEFIKSCTNTERFIGCLEVENNKHLNK